ncbi:CtsR family transcriptional regulator [Mahella australiensis]|uniref:Transcriptional regulator CtsR n=1 Tax=Mahella australiensis (strain DSM 15567 / CIP 107919 / 50-1 BON) TaxID=697281 RepID=F3ZYC6_MAHA5|nr:CtsR family transcriptional regulator [Mahella australiensis]AEE95651.1 transcriptional repressor, CtsR [Mahella australiensis 50-1 BON]
MVRLSDVIEAFIKDMLNTSQDGVLELQRNELAARFRCAPSQINYVLSTRFTIERGYYIESRRGGGGCIRIMRMNVEKDDYILYLLFNAVGDSLSQACADNIIDQLSENGDINDRIAALMRSAVSDKAIEAPSADRDKIRAGIMKSMLVALLSF